MLEAASLRKPVVCFQDSGGPPEFIEGDAGMTVPYLDIPAMARAVLTLVEDAALRQQLGRRAAEKVRERHDVEVAAPQLLSIIRQQLQASP
jgi:glycosyltransferase involved in cell wall biosynthesis